MKRFARFASPALCGLVLLAASLDMRAQAAPDPSEEFRQDHRIRNLESKLDLLSREVRQIAAKTPAAGSLASVAWLFGAFCALWAQNTKRNPWLWFFLGLIFSVIAVLFLLAKNAYDTRAKDPRLFSEGRKL